MIRITGLIAVALLVTPSVNAIDLAALWDFSQPDVSEERFRAALETATGDDALILHTQIARTYVLRKDFGRARELLNEVQPKVEDAGPEARARYWLELGRTHASHQHPADTQTAEAKQLARDAYARALQIAEHAHLDGLAIDVVHMFAFVDTAPADQLKWGQEALAMVEASDQAQTKRWEPSVRSNIGEALYDLGRYDEALEQFQRASELFEQGTNDRSIRDGHWHVARALRACAGNTVAFGTRKRGRRRSQVLYFRGAGDPVPRPRQ